MAGKSRQSANLTSKNNIFVDAVADNTGIGSTSPKSKLDVVGNARISGILTVGVSSSVTIDGNAGIVSATKLYAAGIDVSSFIAGAGYANTSGIATVALGIVTTANINTSGIITASNFVGVGSGLTGVIGVSTQWITTSAGIHTLSNVGIGTTNPGTRLEIIGSGPHLRVSNSVTSGYGYIQLGRSSTASQNWHFGSEGNNYLNFWNGNSGSGVGPLLSLYSSGSTSTHAVLIGGSGVSPSFTGTASQPLQVTGGAYVSGNLGIGALIPLQKIHIVGNGFFTGNLGIANPNPNLVIGTSHIAIGNFFALYSGLVATPAPTIPSIRGSTANNLVLSAGNNGAVFINNDNGSNGLFVNAGGGSTTWFRIDSTGKVGINTSVPVQNLDVSGTVHILNNLGIGTTNPSQKLDVIGNVKASNFIGNLTGISTTAITAENVTETININTSGIVTATKFVGDGSGLSGIVAAGSGGISLQNDSSPVGTAGTINFDNNFDLEISGGIATVTFLTAPGLTTTASVNTTGIITASNFSGNFTGTFVGSGSSLTGVIGLSTQWITTSAGIHTLSKVGIGTTNPVSNLEVFGTVSVAGTSGQLFSVVDSLATGSIFSVNDISGIPSIDVDADGTIELAPFNGDVGIGTTRARARLDVLGSVLVTNISAGIVTATTFSGNIVTRVNGSVGIVSVGIVSMTDFQYQPQGVVTLTDRWDLYNAINSSGGWDISTNNSLPTIRLNWVPSVSQNGTSGTTWRTNFLDKVKTGDLVQWSKDGINWNSFIQPFDSYSPGSNSVAFYAGASVPTGGSMYVRYITTRATGVQALQNGQILQYDSAYTKWMPFGPYANWESTSAGINTLRSVGIGTTNPTSRLTIEGGGITVRTTTSNSFLVLDAGIGPATGNQVSFIDFKFNGDLKGNIAINESFSTTPLEINSVVSNDVIISSGGGRVGIGTTNLSSRLTVSGDVLVSGVVTASSFIGTTFIGTSFVGNLTGTATTAINLTSDTSVNTTGVITATKFVGDGSGLTGIVATSSGGIFLQNDSINIGAASTINFTSNFTVESAAGIATVGINTASTITAAAFVGDGSGLTNVSGGGGASSRTVVSGITTALVVNGIGNTEIAGFKTYGVLKVGVSSAAWVRLYTDSTSRSNDASRSIEVDPITGSGVIAEVATAGIATVKMTPFIVGFNDDDPVTTTIYVAVKNLTGITTSISVNLTILKMEE